MNKNPSPAHSSSSAEIVQSIAARPWPSHPPQSPPIAPFPPSAQSPGTTAKSDRSRTPHPPPSSPSPAPRSHYPQIDRSPAASTPATQAPAATPPSVLPYIAASSN